MDYQSYRKTLSQCLRFIKCPFCSKNMKVREFPQHRRECHHSDHNPHLSCSFCDKVHWFRGKKAFQGAHLKECLDSFIEKHQTRQERKDPAAEPMEGDEDTPCGKCQAFYEDPDPKRMKSLPSDPMTQLLLDTDFKSEVPSWLTVEPREEIAAILMGDISNEIHCGDTELVEGDTSEDISESASGPTLPESTSSEGILNTGQTLAGEGTGDMEWSENTLNELPESTLMDLLNTATFHPDTGLREAHEWVRRYLRFGKMYHWMHLILRAGSMQSFMKEMAHVDLCISPFWCTCNAEHKPNQDVWYSYHRHMLVVARDRVQYQRAFRKIRFMGRKSKDEKKGYARVIQSKLHFINTMYYVSNAKAMCTTSYVDEFHRGQHSNLNTPINPHARAWLSLFVDGLPDEYVRMAPCKHNVGNVDTKKILGRLWYARTEEFCFRNCVPRFMSLSWRIDKEHPIEDLKYYVDCEGAPFVRWLNNVAYPLIQDDHTNNHFENLSKLEYARHHVKNKANVMMNLNEEGDWFVMSRQQQKILNEVHANVNELKLHSRREMDHWKKMSTDKDNMIKILELEKDLVLKELLKVEEAFKKVLKELSKEKDSKEKLVADKDKIIQFLENELARLTI